MAQQLEFKGVPMGATKAEFKAAHPEFDCERRPQCIGLAIQYAGVKSDAIAEFSDGRLVAITVYFDPSSTIVVADALASKYGAPSSVEESEFRTRGGAVAINEERKWLLPDGGEILTRRYGSAINQGRAELYSPDGVRYRAAEIEKLKQNAAKGI